MYLFELDVSDQAKLMIMNSYMKTWDPEEELSGETLRDAIGEVGMCDLSDEDYSIIIDYLQPLLDDFKERWEHKWMACEICHKQYHPFGFYEDDDNTGIWNLFKHYTTCGSRDCEIRKTINERYPDATPDNMPILKILNDHSNYHKEELLYYLHHMELKDMMLVRNGKREIIDYKMVVVDK
jgi:hypothetical protein